MSGPGSNGDSYRCDACRHRTARCDACREARAAYKRDLRAKKRAAGLCIECAEPAIEGQTRCVVHEARNRKSSKVAHRRRRKAAIG
jgi:hypothetical protein